MNIFFIQACVAIVVSFGATYLVIPWLSSFAHHIHFLDVPDGNIKQHVKPVPYLGGLAAYIGFILAIWIVLPFNRTIGSFVIGLTVLLLTGLLDDFLVLQPSQKILGQICSALCFLNAGFYLKEQFFSVCEWVTIPLSFLWILTVINAFNLIDVMDGLATIVAGTSLMGFLLLALASEQVWVALLFCSLLGSLIAFFLYNRPPARMYLGDAGSLFLGGFFAVIPFLFPWGKYTAYGFLTPLILLVIPLLELVSLIIIRSYKKIPFYRGSADHFSHYLLRNMWSKWGILGYSALINIVGALVGYEFFMGYLSLIPMLSIGGIFLIFWYILLFI